MKIINIIALLIFAVISTGASQISTLELERGTMTWKGKAAFSNYYLSGSLDPLRSNIYLNNQVITRAEVVVDMTSLDAENDQLKGHLRSEDFFEVAKYTEATFILTKEIRLSNQKLKLAGELTIKDKTNPIEMEVLIVEKDEKWTVKGKLIVNRTDYGIYYNSPNFFKNLKEQAIADEFELDFELIFNRLNK